MLKIIPYALISFVISLISMPIIIYFCSKKGLYDYQDERKIHSGNIPRLGGVGIIISFLVVVIFYLVYEDQLFLKNSVPILIAGVIIFVFAIIDDILNLRALIKLIVQLFASAIVTVSGFRFTQIFGWHLPTILSFLITFCWILGVINAYNLIDGLDGLCGSLSITAISALGVLYVLSNNMESGICFILAGSILGFLCFNWPPAKLFMGDGGSQFLGFMIATVPLYTSCGESFEYNKFLIMIILTSFPVFDTIAAIWRRLRDKRPIMSPDKSHLHHKLLNMGYSGKQTLFLIDFIQVLLCLAVILSFFIGTLKGTAILFETLIFMVIFFSVIHYTNRAVNLKKKEDELLKQKEAGSSSESSKDKPDLSEKPEIKI